MLRRSVARRVFVANALGVPSVVAGMSYLLSADAETLMPHVLIATGDVLTLAAGQQWPDAYITWGARPLIAEAMAQAWARQYGTVDEATIIARMFGELTAVAHARGKNQREDMMMSRNQLALTLQQHPPSMNEFRSLITDILSRCRMAGNTMYTADRCRTVISPAMPLSALRILRDEGTRNIIQYVCKPGF